jgi:hypothetical protein
MSVRHQKGGGKVTYQTPELTLVGTAQRVVLGGELVGARDSVIPTIGLSRIDSLL